MRVHLIAIGGAVMHNLALALQAAGHTVTGSDDTLHDPSRSRLADAGLLPEAVGWFPEKITAELDAVILGKHAHADNPELAQAQTLGLPLYTFPEYVYAQSRNRQRIAIAGSHGKTTVTAMALHVLHALGREVNYLVGASLPGLERSVRLEDTAPAVLIEADEYPTSALDNAPKFLKYHPHVIVLTGIAWDHINAFPTEASYLAAFEQLLKNLPKAGVCIYNKGDKRLKELVKRHLDPDIHTLLPYEPLKYKYKDDRMAVRIGKQRVPVEVYGAHNAANLAAAKVVCEQLAVSEEQFAQHIASFAGAGLRLETVHEDENTLILRDYAHAPSKLVATVAAVQERFPEHDLVVAYELHTYSSLDKKFLPHYKGTLKNVAKKVVFVDGKALEVKRKEPIHAKDVQKGFQDEKIAFVKTPEELLQRLRQLRAEKTIFLMMSSGNFGGLEFTELAA